MKNQIKVKICGLTRESDLDAAISGGADYVGFVFYPRSPRNVSIDLFRRLAHRVPDSIIKTVLTVDATDEEICRICNTNKVDMLQLHGKEATGRIQELKSRFGIPIMKAVGITHSSDLEKLDQYIGIADQVLIDAKPVFPEDLPGGNGITFDWNLIAGISWKLPWMLAGGLNMHNVRRAIMLTHSCQVDVSSGVEALPGKKAPNMIKDFIKAAKGI